jgi:hypothetical protein
MENDELQKKLKKQATLTDEFIRIVDKIKIDDKDVPKTEKGMTSKAKELLERVERKLEKITDEELNVHSLKKKRLKQEIEKSSGKEE